MAAAPWTPNSTSFTMMPAANITRPVAVNGLLRSIIFLSAIKARRYILINARKIKWRYPMIMGRKPNARIVIWGYTEKNCSSTFNTNAQMASEYILRQINGSPV